MYLHLHKFVVRAQVVLNRNDESIVQHVVATLLQRVVHEKPSRQPALTQTMPGQNYQFTSGDTPW
jgi:hypothetical protein